jgi:hypothetical protein
MVHQLFVGSPHYSGKGVVGEAGEQMVDVGAAEFTDFCFFNDGLESRGSDFGFGFTFEETTDEYAELKSITEMAAHR